MNYVPSVRIPPTRPKYPMTDSVDLVWRKITYASGAHPHSEIGRLRSKHLGLQEAASRVRDKVKLAERQIEAAERVTSWPLDAGDDDVQEFGLTLTRAAVAKAQLSTLRARLQQANDSVDAAYNDISRAMERKSQLEREIENWTDTYGNPVTLRQAEERRDALVALVGRADQPDPPGEDDD